MISNTIKLSLEFLLIDFKKGDVKQHKGAKFPDVEKTLYKWIILYQERVDMIGELITKKAKKFLKNRSMILHDSIFFKFSLSVSNQNMRSKHIVILEKVDLLI